MTDDNEMADRLRSVTELLSLIALDPSVLGVLTEDERIRLVNAAGDVFAPDVELRRRRVRARQRRDRDAKLRRDEATLAEHRHPAAAGEARVHDAQRLSARGVRTGRLPRRP